MAKDPTYELRKLVADVNASAFLMGDDVPVPSRKGEHRLVKLVRNKFTRQQTELLIDLLEGEAALIVVHGEQYAVRFRKRCYMVCGLELDSEEHTVDRTVTSCSCPDCVYRKRDCKHVLAIRRFNECCTPS